MKLKDAFNPRKKSYDKPRQCNKKQRHHFTDKGPSSQSYGFSSNHIQIWELDHKGGWASKNCCFRTVVLEKILESPLYCKEIKPVNPKRKSTLNIHWKNWCWSSSSLSTWCKLPTHWKRPWCWERLKAKGKEGGRGWDGYIASRAQYTWLWTNSGG